MDEAGKLKKHLSLLREEFVKLQQKHSELERKYNLIVASTGGGEVQENSFICRLLRTVSNLYDHETYSDLDIMLEKSTVKAHKFVLSARSDNWGVPDLNTVDQLDFASIQQDIALELLKWVYTDHIQLHGRSEEFILDVMKVAKQFDLEQLVEKCEKTLMSFVNVRNCIKFYQISDELAANNLRAHCSELISTHWDDFTSDDFQHMTAPLLYSMFKQKTDYPLHTAIRTAREDVVFLYLMEYDSQLASKVNEIDSTGDIPLDIALKTKQESVARTLVNHRANVNLNDSAGKSLLHRAIDRRDQFSSDFLIDNHANVDAMIASDKQTPLHLISSQDQDEAMTRVAKKLLTKGADTNYQDISGNTPLHLSILNRNVPIFELLINQPRITLESRNSDGFTPLALALRALPDQDLFANTLVDKKASVDATHPKSGDTLLHLAARDLNETAGIFLASKGAKINAVNNSGETPLHIAAANGLLDLVQTLLRQGANCNLLTSPTTFSPSPVENSKSDSNKSSPFDESNPFNSPVKQNHNSGGDHLSVFNQTALHLAIMGKHEQIVEAIVRNKPSAGLGQLNAPNLNLKNSRQQTPLTLALKYGLHQIAQLLIDEGASVNVTNFDGLTLLHEAIKDGDSRSAMFLLNYGADFSIPTPSGESPLQLAISHKLEPVVMDLCAKGADVNARDSDGDPLIWKALETGNDDVASVLVQFNADTDCWGPGPDECYQTLLHRAIDENNEHIATFLIRSGCDLNSPRRPSPSGAGGDEAYDGQTPLHLACTWALEHVVQTLLEFGANLNAKDAEGKTPLHVAIINQHDTTMKLLLSIPNLDLDIRDKYGATAFATAMTIKNNKAAQAILDRCPTAAEKFDGKGRNFLHIAIQKADIESVLFLLGIHVNIHSRVQDASKVTPLHLAVEAGSEMIVRNLLLAGANVNDVDVKKQTALHYAAEKDHAAICSILLENGIDYNALDTNLNNALMVACREGNLATVKVLLQESNIDASAVNLKGQNCLHLISQYGKEDRNAAIFELFITSMPDYNINRPDAEGNTPLLLAYMNGNANLTKALVKAGACLGACNRQGVNIFNAQVASNGLLYKLLDYLPAESAWTEGDQCSECGTKFGITNRKHHCRHCGRILCARCSSKETPIVKFNLNKPVRVCETCFDVLVLGFNS